MDDIGRKRLPHETPLWMSVSRQIYFVTICARERESRPLLPIAQDLIDAIAFYHAKAKWWATLAVVMPDHVHLLVSFPEELSPTGIVRSWKRWTAGNLGANWQRDFFEHRLRREESEREKADYLLQNPVRAGLAAAWQEGRGSVWKTVAAVCDRRQRGPALIERRYSKLTHYRQEWPFVWMSE